MSPVFGGVEYDEAGFAHMQELHNRWKAETDPDEKKALLAEAETFHEIYKQFEPVTMHNVEALSDPDENRIGKFSNPAKSGAPPSQRDGALSVYPRSGTQRRSLLNLIGERVDGISDEQANDILDIGIRQTSARRNELMDGGWVRKSGRTTRARSGVEVELWELTPAGRAQWRPE